MTYTVENARPDLMAKDLEKKAAAGLIAIREISDKRISGEFGPIQFFLDFQPPCCPGDLAGWSGDATFEGESFSLDITKWPHTILGPSQIPGLIFPSLVEFASHLLSIGKLALVTPEEAATIGRNQLKALTA